MEYAKVNDSLEIKNVIQEERKQYLTLTEIKEVIADLEAKLTHFRDLETKCSELGVK